MHQLALLKAIKEGLCTPEEIGSALRLSQAQVLAAAGASESEQSKKGACISMITNPKWQKYKEATDYATRISLISLLFFSFKNVAVEVPAREQRDKRTGDAYEEFLKAQRLAWKSFGEDR